MFIAFWPKASSWARVKRIESSTPLSYRPAMSQFGSPFIVVPVSDWLCYNELAIAIFDGFPVSLGHSSLPLAASCKHDPMPPKKHRPHS
jgi:hypothetical protein